LKAYFDNRRVDWIHREHNIIYVSADTIEVCVVFDPERTSAAQSRIFTLHSVLAQVVFVQLALNIIIDLQAVKVMIMIG
jgi:hypothetical protein